MLVYKYPLKIGTTDIKLPQGSEILDVQEQDGSINLWIEVNLDMPETIRKFEIIGTGHEVPRASHYIGTVQQSRFVWHVYEILK